MATKTSAFKYVPPTKPAAKPLTTTPPTNITIFSSASAPAHTSSSPHTTSTSTQEASSSQAEGVSTLPPQTQPRAEQPIASQRLDLSNLFPGKRDAFALILDNVFTPAECQTFIDKSEKAGYDEALVGGQQVRVSQQRNNWRCIIDDTEMAELVFMRVFNYLPQEWLGAKLAEVNERMRFLKYHPGEYFKPHNDGIYVREDNSQCSYVTIHLYLNDVPEGWGGETTFTTQEMTYGRHLQKAGRREGEEIKTLAVRPVAGRVLVFEHHLPHEGSTLLKGVKYTVRTDVMYDLGGGARRRKGERGQRDEKEQKGASSGGSVVRGKEVHRGPRWSVKYPHPQYKLGIALSK